MAVKNKKKRYEDNPDEGTMSLPETGYDYPIGSRVVERIVDKVLAEQEFLQRLQHLEEHTITLEQLAVLDISMADVRLPTGEKFDLAEILDIHDRGISELKALNPAPKLWVRRYINNLGVVTSLNFKDKMLSTRFPVGDQPDRALQDWLTVPPEEPVTIQRMAHGFQIVPSPVGFTGPTGARPTGQVGLVGPVPGDGIGDMGIVTPPPSPVPTGRPVRDQVVTNIQNVKTLEQRTDSLDQGIIDHGARLNAVEGDIEGLIAGMPVVGLPTASEILLSILPLDFTRNVTFQGLVSQSLEAWLKSFPTYTEIHDLVIADYTDKINRNRGDIADNKREIDYLEDQVFGPIMESAGRGDYFASNFYRFIHQDFTVTPDSRNPMRTIPWYLSTEWIDPITGQLKWNKVREQTGENAVDLRSLEADTNTRLVSLEDDVRDIIGDRAVLGIEDYNSIVDHLRARQWPIGDETLLFQTWMEQFNSRTLGNRQLLDNLDLDLDDLRQGVGDYDLGLKGDFEFRGFMQAMKDEMAGMKDAFKTISEDVKNFRPEFKKIVDEMNEGFVFPMSIDTFAEILGMAFDRLMSGGIMEYEKGGVEAFGFYEFTGLKNAFGSTDSEGLRGSSNAMSGSADSFGDYGERDLDWSPI